MPYKPTRRATLAADRSPTAAAVFAPLLPVRVSVNVHDFPVDSRILTTIGIVLNELITNSVKHAFGDKEEGRIAVETT
jgi:two-component sensor histidine kinase